MAPSIVAMASGCGGTGNGGSASPSSSGSMSGVPNDAARGADAGAQGVSARGEPVDGGSTSAAFGASSGPSDGATVDTTDMSDGPVGAADATMTDTGTALGTDGGGPRGDAAGGVGGPYKGVANSACGDLPRLGSSWWYNWTLSPGSCKVSEFVPMVWGHAGNEQSAAGIATETTALVNAGYKVVLGFNEPDNTSQSNISVSAAIALWPNVANLSLRVGSPATQGNAAGLTWIQAFMAQANADTTGKLRVDFIATHWYGWNAGSCDGNATNLESWIKQIEAIPGGRPIWLTEWGCLNQSNPSLAVVQAFFSGAIAMFARHPRVERYAWYPWSTNNSLVANGALTSLGAAFAAAPSIK